MTYHLRWMRPLGVLAAVLIGLVGCGSSSKSNSTAPTTASTAASATTGPAASSPETTAAPAAGSSGAIAIKGFAFTPTPLTVKVGDTITITNNDTTDHTVTDGGGAFDTGHISSGTSKTITITKAGTYNYHCNIHKFMMGVVQAGP
jgi:plastocyanin